jgi:hypothetical protein
MNISKLHNLPAVEKIKIIEAIWHETELKETEEKYLTGDIEVLDWQLAKKQLRSQFE